ncbi:MAG: sugar ABC transporter permease [Candidatus Thermoplasmatota archaeon]|nr:sugar ABC transporter permease [Candidatus Thermoplasmatota archaeon]MCL5881523.1 sugar ABC transporter permease [Candidatus Thermoplasmatota archaeon]
MEVQEEPSIRDTFKMSRKYLIYILMAAPAIAYVIGLSIFPAITVIYDSFHVNGQLSLRNYASLPGYGLYPSIVNTLIVSVGALIIQVVLALAIAMVMVKPFKGSKIFSTIVIIPFGVSTIVSAFAFSLIFQNVGGFANGIIVALGFKPVTWFSSTLSDLGVVMFSDFWKNTPLVALILYGGLSSVSPSLYESASMDGAGPLSRFVHITLPNIAPLLSIALLVRGVSEFNIFALPLVLIGYHPLILNTLIYENYSTLATRPISYAAATVLLAIIMVYSILVLRIGGAKQYAQ